MRRPLSFMSTAMFALVTVLLAACAPSPSQRDRDPVPPPVGVATLYVLETGTGDVRVMDAAGNTIKKVPVGRQPSAIDAEGGYVYVANRGDNTVSVIDVTSNTVVKTIAVGNAPSALTGDPASVYVANAASNSVSQIDVKSNAVVQTFASATQPVSMALVQPHYLAVLSGADSTVAYQDLNTYKTVQTFNVPAQSVSLASSGSESFYVVTSSGELAHYATTTLDSDTLQLLKTYPVPAGASTLSYLTPHETLMLCSSGASTCTAFSVDELDKTVGKMQTVEAGAGAASAIDADPNPDYSLFGGSYDGKSAVFVANSQSDSISVYAATASSKIGDVNLTAKQTFPLDAGSHPTQIAIYMSYSYAPVTPVPTSLPSISPSPSPTSSSTASPSPTPSPTPSSTPAGAAYLYVADSGNNAIDAFSLPVSTTSAAAFTFANTAPYGLAANASYVAVSHANRSIDLYTQPVAANARPVITFTSPARGLAFLKFDAAGDLWAASFSAVYEFTPPFSASSAPAATITAGISSAVGLAFDSANNLYVTNGGPNGTIVAYAPPYTSPFATVAAVSGGGSSLQDAAVFGSRLYVADDTNGVLFIYSLPLHNGDVPADAVNANSPFGLAFDTNGNLYASESAYNDAAVYASPITSASSPLLFSNSGLMLQPAGMAVSQ